MYAQYALIVVVMFAFFACLVWWLTEDKHSHQGEQQ